MPDEDVVVPDAQDAPQPDLADAPQEGTVSDPQPDAADAEGAAGSPGAPDEPTDLDSLWARYPTLRELNDTALSDRDRERENAGANRERARLQREAGKKDSTRQNVARFLAEQGVDVDDTQRLDYFYDLAAANSAMELATAIPEAILRNYTLPPAVREQAIAARENGDWDGYVTQYVTGAVDAGITQKVGTLSLKDIPADSALRKEIDAENQVWRAAELRALRASAAPRSPGGLPVPQGNAGGPTPYSQMTSEQRAALSPSERDAAVAAMVGAI